MSETSATHVAVIGGGPAGYAAAFKAADLGLQVTLIDQEKNPGGVCLYRGCIPSKALLHVAKLIHETAEASEWGLDFAAPKIDLPKMRDFKNGVIGKLTGGLGQLTRARGITYINGRAEFADDHSLTITGADGESRLTADAYIVAVGSSPTKIPGISIDDPRVLDSTGALELEDIPKSLLVIGGGYIGLEMGTVYAALGSKVTVVEMMDGILPGADRDLADVLAKRIDSMFDSVRLKTKVCGVKALKSGIKVSFEDAEGKASTQTFAKILVSVGRRPNSHVCGLENTGVQLDQNGFIKVDGQQRSTVPHIFAIGDIAGEPMLAHKGSHEGIVAAETIAGHAAAFEPNAIPAVVFTDPELAWCGVTESEALARGLNVKVARFPWAASGRATTLGRNDGLTKLIIDVDSERILGMGICGTGAGELIAEGVLAVEMAATANDLKLSIHAHPTLSETVMESAELFFGSSTHMYRGK
ncbi:MAG: dihydrolipoamide dehydrogenase [Rhodothermales bacterium]|jgi:dihydrolipoamide dehydrogenase